MQKKNKLQAHTHERSQNGSYNIQRKIASTRTVIHVDCVYTDKVGLRNMCSLVRLFSKKKPHSSMNSRVVSSPGPRPIPAFKYFTLKSGRVGHKINVQAVCSRKAYTYTIHNSQVSHFLCATLKSWKWDWKGCEYRLFTKSMYARSAH